MYSVGAEAVVGDYAVPCTTFDEFIGNMQIKIISRTESHIAFDLVNAHPSIANALRRILIAEVPTIAIHNISVRENDTIFPDEYIAHRLGLIPLDADPEMLDYSGGECSPGSTLSFRLTVRNDTPEVQSLYSDQIVWVPQEGQEHLRAQLQPGVLICKMAPGNTIDMAIFAEKGIGARHAKWSPVSLCSYRLMPRIVLEKDFDGEDAGELQGCFSRGVIDIVDGRAVVVDPRLETVSREVFRHDKFKDSVKIFRENGWFCFTVESIALDPLYLLRKAVSTLADKCRLLKQEVLSLHEE